MLIAVPLIGKYYSDNVAIVPIMEYASIRKEGAEKWRLSDRRVRILCAEGKIPGAYQRGRGWKIPENAVKPADERYKTSTSLLEIIDRKKAELDTRRPLTEGEVARLTEPFAVEYTYNSNAIEGNTRTKPFSIKQRGWSREYLPITQFFVRFST